jgi:hypothetical protein
MTTGRERREGISQVTEAGAEVEAIEKVGLTRCDEMERGIKQVGQEISTDLVTMGA